MKKWLSLVLVLTMVLSLCSGFAQAEEKVEVTIAVARHSMDITESYEEKYFVKLAEENTNVHVNWIEVSDADQGTVLATMLAGEMPDAFIGLITDEIIIQNPQLFANLTDKVEDKLPNFVTYCAEKNIDWKSYMTYPDGNIYGVMGGYYSSPNNQANGVAWINTQWLENLGLAMPTTAEELYNVLVAFRDNDANGNGDPTDEIPYDFCQNYYASKIWNLTSMFGIPGYVRYADGKALPTVNTDAFFNALTTLNTWMKEGLINPEGFTQSSQQYASNEDNIVCGVFCEWAPYSSIKTAEKQAQYDVMVPVAFEGYEASWPSNTEITAMRNSLVISAGSPYVDEILGWWNYLSTDEDMAISVRNAEKGMVWDRLESGEATSVDYTEADLIANGYEKFVSVIGTSTLNASLGHCNSHPLFYEAPLPVAGSNNEVRLNGILATKPHFNGFAPQAMVPADALEEFSFATEGLEEFIDNFTATAIINGVTREQFDSFTSELSAYGYDYYIDFYQKSLDNAF